MTQLYRSFKFSEVMLNPQPLPPGPDDYRNLNSLGTIKQVNKVSALQFGLRR